MTTPIFVTSFLNRVPTATNGGGIFNSGGGTPTFGTTNARASGGYMICAPSASAVYANKTYTVANVAVYSFYFRLPSIPSAYSLLASFWTTAGGDGYFGYNSTQNKFYMSIGGGTEVYLTGITPTANTWYRLDAKITANTNPRTIDWEIAVDDGSAPVSGPQASGSVAGSTCRGIQLGTDSASYTYTCWYSDLIISTTSGDYPIGEHDTVLMTPSADGTHNAGTNTMEDNAGTDIGSTTAYDKINSVASGAPSSSTYIRQATANTGAYIEVDMSNIPSGATPLGVTGFIAYTSATTTANQMAAGAWDGSTFYEIWGNPTTRADYSDGSTASLYYKSAMISLGTLNEANVNALKFRAGYSNDVSPNPYLIDAWFECAYVAGSGSPSTQGLLMMF